METRPLRVLIVEPEIILRNALLDFIDVSDNLKAAGSAASAAEAIQLCQATCPDVILIEIQLPDMHGVEVIRHLHKQFPDVPLVVLTTANQSDLMREVLLAGATGWLEKWMSVDRVVEALHLAARKALHQRLQAED